MGQGAGSSVGAGRFQAVGELHSTTPRHHDQVLREVHERAGPEVQPDPEQQPQRSGTSCLQLV